MSRGLVGTCVAAGGLCGAVAVITGAFGAHALKATLDATGQAANWETASRYALMHALALVTTGLVAALPGASRGLRSLAAAAWCFALGTAVFSGSLWALALTGIRVLGAVVPIGGSLLVAGWALLATGGMRLGREADSGGAGR
ncbi:MAG: DUF423 domain-containing protein [Planctomycetaceae bacterium]